MNIQYPEEERIIYCCWVNCSKEVNQDYFVDSAQVFYTIIDFLCSISTERGLLKSPIIDLLTNNIYCLIYFDALLLVTYTFRVNMSSWRIDI